MYPYPIHDTQWLAQRIADPHAVYLGAWHGDELAAVGVAELDGENRNAEMTDFATDRRFRGRGLASLLLARLEQQSAALGLRTVFSVARAGSAAMNVPFARTGYAYGGQLVNNIHFAAGWESMNIWHKPLC